MTVIELMGVVAFFVLAAERIVEWTPNKKDDAIFGAVRKLAEVIAAKPKKEVKDD